MERNEENAQAAEDIGKQRKSGSKKEQRISGEF